MRTSNSENWVTLPLGELCEFRRGLTYRKSDEVEEGGTPVLRASNVDLSSGQLDLNEIRYIDASIEVPSAKKVVVGSLLICTASGSKKHLGKTALIEDEMDFAFGGFMGLLVPCSRLLPSYLQWLLRGDAYWAFINSLSDGANINNLKFKQLSAFPVPLPPLEEQQRIVAVLDEAFEGLTRAREHAEANLRNARELFESSISKFFTNTDGWEICSVSDLGQVFDGPHATPKTVEYGPIFLGISSLVDGRIELSKTRHVSEHDYEKWTRRVEPQAGDVVFSYETRLGQVGLIPNGLRCCLGRRMGLIRLDRNKIMPEFFTAYYLSPYFQRFLRDNTVKGATVDRISIKQFPTFPVTLPSIERQKMMVAEIARLRQMIDELSEQASKKIDLIDSLRQSLLQQAFAGELT